MLLDLMDEAYTGSAIADGEADSESEDNNTIDVADPLFLDLLKDENDGLAVCFSPVQFIIELICRQIIRHWYHILFHGSAVPMISLTTAFVV